MLIESLVVVMQVCLWHYHYHASVLVALERLDKSSLTSETHGKEKEDFAKGTPFEGLAGLIAISDGIKPEAATTIQHLMSNARNSLLQYN